MARRRYVQIDGELIEVPMHYVPEPQVVVRGDIPAYESPATGKIVDGRRQRREDLKASGCREWEGMKAERENADRQKAYAEQRLEEHAEMSVRRAWSSMSPSKRAALRNA